jgi:GNAT superfamily N-acetyltransferase
VSSTDDLRWSDTIDDVDWDELSALYRVAPLGDKPPALLQVVFGNSRYRCFVRDAAGRLVGAGRVLADGADCAYLCDIAVLPTHQGSGLGQAIVGRLVECARGHRKIILYAVPGKEPFYRRFGFRRLLTAMAIFPDAEAAARRGYLGD